MNKKHDIFKLKHNNIIPKQGLVLVSEPFAPDSIFSRSVILLAEHNKDGAVGFILNKPFNRKISDFSSEFGNFDMNISFGGPVESEHIYYIHTYGKKIPGSTQIKDNLYWGGEFSIIQTLSEAGKLEEEKIRFFVGYSGWTSEQLMREINKDFWLVSDIDVGTIMRNDKKIWNKTVSELEKPYKIWQYFPENPNLN
ncbi:MAG: YqgE/AlgH family protein [Bacteroidales bacterium]|nr:YqgE/AlgH family protein [Bacteroidales bacterium]